jgi:hypothetical protein
MLSGLVLDYNIFLFDRIVEYRENKYTDKTSIIKGMSHSMLDI